MGVATIHSPRYGGAMPESMFKPGPAFPTATTTQLKAMQLTNMLSTPEGRFKAFDIECSMAQAANLIEAADVELLQHIVWKLRDGKASVVVLDDIWSLVISSLRARAASYEKP